MKDGFLNTGWGLDQVRLTVYLLYYEVFGKPSTSLDRLLSEADSEWILRVTLPLSTPGVGNMLVRS
jgi:hypothetical protein